MAETRVDLNTGFTSGPAGLGRVSRIALDTNTPEALANDTGVLKRKVLEPDEFPRVSLDIMCPHDPEMADIDQAPVFPQKKGPWHQGKIRGHDPHDGKSLTA